MTSVNMRADPEFQGLDFTDRLRRRLGTVQAQLISEAIWHLLRLAWSWFKKIIYTVARRPIQTKFLPVRLSVRKGTPVGYRRWCIDKVKLSSCLLVL